ncbi:MAG: hypothetical protein U0575_12295 [Phycisphaerales bacterium]
MPAAVLESLSAAAAPDPSAVGRYVNIFAATASLLGAFLLAVILLMFVRRRRIDGAARRSDDSSALPDPWTEAGRRAEPFDAPGRRPPS